MKKQELQIIPRAFPFGYVEQMLPPTPRVLQALEQVLTQPGKSPSLAMLMNQSNSLSSLIQL